MIKGSDTLLFTHEDPKYINIQTAFIDNYMFEASGSYVKIYLYVLRCYAGNLNLTAAEICDKLDITPRYFETTLKYWEECGIIKIARKGTTITGVTFLNIEDAKNSEIAPKSIALAGNDCGFDTDSTDSYSNSGIEGGFDTDSSDNYSNSDNAGYGNSAGNAASDIEGSSRYGLKTPGNENDNKFADINNGESSGNSKEYIYSPAQISDLVCIPEVKKMIECFQQNINRTMKSEDTQMMLYYYESIGVSADLLMYLYEYCGKLEKTDSSYIKAVIEAWIKRGITDREGAKKHTEGTHEIFSAYKRAMGIETPLPEKTRNVITEWVDVYGYDLEIIITACEKAVMSAKGGAPNLNYVRKIVDDWHDNGLSNINEINNYEAKKKLEKDLEFEAKKKKKASPSLSYNSWQKPADPEEATSEVAKKLALSNKNRKNRLSDNNTDSNVSNGENNT